MRVGELVTELQEQVDRTVMDQHRLIFGHGLDAVPFEQTEEINRTARDQQFKEEQRRHDRGFHLRGRDPRVAVAGRNISANPVQPLLSILKLGVIELKQMVQNARIDHGAVDEQPVIEPKTVGVLAAAQVASETHHFGIQSTQRVNGLAAHEVVGCRQPLLEIRKINGLAATDLVAVDLNEDVDKIALIGVVRFRHQLFQAADGNIFVGRQLLDVHTAQRSYGYMADMLVGCRQFLFKIGNTH